MNLNAQTKNFLKDLNLRPKKKLGQNFLINIRTARTIFSEVKKNRPPYIEIGPGAGALTRLFPPSEIPSLTLIEKDKKIAGYWRERGFSVLQQDALKTNRAQLPSPSTLFGNLPYHLAGPLILKLSPVAERFSALIFMMQDEVSERMRAGHSTKDYGLLSVMAQTFWDMKRTAFAGKKDFYPSPKVEGRVLTFRPKKTGESAQQLLTFLKMCFAQRRKKLIRKLPVPLTLAEKLLSEMNHGLNARAEELTPEDFVRLHTQIRKFHKK